MPGAAKDDLLPILLEIQTMTAYINFFPLGNADTLRLFGSI